MSGGQIALFDEPLNLLREGQQAHGVGHRRAGLAHPLGGLLLGQAVVLDQGAVARRLFHGVQVLPLEVFNEAKLHDLPVVGLYYHGGDFGEARHPGGPPPPLPGDDLVISGGQPPHRQGLEDAVTPDGRGQLPQPLVVKGLSGLMGIWPDVRHPQGQHPLSPLHGTASFRFLPF